jgi:hypothetical protein
MKSLAFLALLAACTYDPATPPPATRDDVLAACVSFHEAACAKWAECEAWPAARLDQCIADTSAFCDPAARACWDLQVTAFEHCADAWSSRTCADSHRDGSAACAFTCPADAP